MLEPDQIAWAHAPYPSAGALRVHPTPEVLLPPESDRPGLNRFDDPDGRVGVRHTATRLIGCLRETLARFRPSPSAEAVLATVEGIDADDVDPPENDTRGIATDHDSQTDEPCWAIWNGTKVSVTSVALDPADAIHSDAVRTVAANYELELPTSWQ